MKFFFFINPFGLHTPPAEITILKTMEIQGIILDEKLINIFCKVEGGNFIVFSMSFECRYIVKNLYPSFHIISSYFSLRLMLNNQIFFIIFLLTIFLNDQTVFVPFIFPCIAINSFRQNTVRRIKNKQPFQ